MINRRSLLSTTGLLFLAGCGGTGTVADLVGRIPVKVELPPELLEAVNDVMAIVRKVEPLAGQIGQVAEIVTKTKEAISGMTSGNATGILSTVAGWLSPLVSLASPLGGTVTKAIATLLPLIGGSRVAARTGMTPHQARAVLRS